MAKSIPTSATIIPFTKKRPDDSIKDQPGNEYERIAAWFSSRWICFDFASIQRDFEKIFEQDKAKRAMVRYKLKLLQEIAFFLAEVFWK